MARNDSPLTYMLSRGVNWANECKSVGVDKHDVRYNASWRTATFELMRVVVFKDDAVPARPTTGAGFPVRGRVTLTSKPVAESQNRPYKSLDELL